jgi:hypothetical protein
VGCAQYSDLPYTEAELHRQVIDKETGKGIPDVLVAFKWTRNEGFSPGGSNTACDHIAMLHTDGEGRYTIASYRGRMGGVAAIYKPGYSEINDPVARREGRDYLKPFRGTAGERFEEIGGVFSPLNCGDAEAKNVLELYRAVYQEAKSIAATEADALRVDRFLASLEAVTYGQKEAIKRITERALKREKERQTK